MGEFYQIFKEKITPYHTPIRRSSILLSLVQQNPDTKTWPNSGRAWQANLTHKPGCEISSCRCGISIAPWFICEWTPISQGSLWLETCFVGETSARAERVNSGNVCVSWASLEACEALCLLNNVTFYVFALALCPVSIFCHHMKKNYISWLILILVDIYKHAINKIVSIFWCLVQTIKI